MKINDGRKICSIDENPIDNIIIDLCTIINRKLSPKYVSPNMITSLSLVTGILSSYFVYNSLFLQGGLSFLLSYFLDCLDGNFARMYNLTSKFGDEFDHFSDDVKEILLVAFFILNKKLSLLEKGISLLIVALLFFGAIFQLSCQEKISGGTSGALKIFKNLCPNKGFIKISRFFGCGTLNIGIVIIFIYFYFVYQM